MVCQPGDDYSVGKVGSVKQLLPGSEFSLTDLVLFPLIETHFQSRTMIIATYLRLFYIAIWPKKAN